MKYEFVDQMRRRVSLEFPPQRVVSLVPSQTELLYDLGLDKEVIGITKFCIHPNEWFRSKTRVGGTKQVKLDIIEKLQPDLIIGNKEENEREQIEALAAKYPVWMSDIKSLDDAVNMIEAIGELVDKAENAKKLSERINVAFGAFQKEYPAPTLPAAYFIWRKPYMVAASDTFVDEMLRIAGFVNVFAERKRYPHIPLEELAKTAPQVILLSSEPYPFKKKHFDEFKRVCPNAVIKLVDGELFSWYGSRLLHTPAYFRRLLNECLIDLVNS
ncbi:MAG: helical backbone metal receptor [Saprospiraceae bacterium]|nr:helical backbone metal receptor [Saprospiraceae bacterium]